MMKISIITINYNNAEGLKSTINSVISQAYNDLEYIIIDGGSKDDSVTVIKQFSERISYWVSEKDNGVYNAMNKGIAKASGIYIIFLNSGDFFYAPNTLCQCYDFIQHNPGADIYYGDIFVQERKSEQSWHKQYPDKITLSYLKRTTINHQASLIKAELFREFGYYPENYKLASDYWLYIVSLLKNKHFEHLSFPMVHYDNNGMSATHINEYIEEMQAIWHELVPTCVADTIKKLESYEHLLSYKMVKIAVQLNKKYQIMKNWK